MVIVQQNNSCILWYVELKSDAHVQLKLQYGDAAQNYYCVMNWAVSRELKVFEC